MILVIDNYDSFTYNLVQEFGVLGAEVVVRRNDRITIEECERLDPTHLVISPGPGRPENAGQSVELVRHFTGRLPILGVCLGHQALAAAAGGEVVRAERLMHGKPSPIHHDERGLFHGLPNPFEAARYHSLLVPEEGLPDALEITARTAEREVMGLRWKESCTVGVQFHPESILTGEGRALLRNFLDAPERPC